MTPPNAKLAELGEIIRLLTAAEVAEALALSERSVRSLIAQGALPVVRVGARAVRVHPDDLQRFIQERRGGRGA